MTFVSKKPLVKAPKQDEAELGKMADYYKKLHGNVWFVRCLICSRVIAVEVSMANGNIPQRGRQIYGYQDLFVTTRTRLDKNQHGQAMVGYQCACGNDTRLGEFEMGEVPTSVMVVNKKNQVVQASAPPRALSPFEREQLRATIALKAASAKHVPDYENNGTVERYESFQLERVA